MPPYMHPWQCNNSWRRPYYTSSMYDPGCPQFYQVPNPDSPWARQNTRLGFPWARQNPMAFLMSEIFQGGPRSRGGWRGDGDVRRCHQDQSLGTHANARHQCGSDPCCSQHESSKTSDRSCPCKPSTRPSEPRCDGRTYSSTIPEQLRCADRTCNTKGQSRCRMENSQPQDPFEFIENVAMPMLVEMLSPERQGSTQARQEGACSSEMPDQTFDTAFDVLIDIIAPFMDDIAGSFPNPEAQESKQSGSEKKPSQHVKDKGQGKKSPASTDTASTSKKSMSEQTADSTVTEKPDEAPPSTNNIASPCTPNVTNFSEAASSKASGDPKAETQRSASQRGEGAMKKRESENAKGPQTGSNLAETPFDFMLNILGPFVHQMAQAHTQQQEAPTSKKPQMSKEGASATKSSSTPTQQEEFVTIPTWFGPMRVKVQKKTSDHPQCRKYATKSEEPKANRMENLVTTPPASRVEEAESPKDTPAVDAETSKATSDLVVDRMTDNQDTVPQPTEVQTSNSSTKADCSDDAKVEVENSQNENDQIPEDSAIQQNSEEAPFTSADKEPISLQFNRTGNDPFVEFENDKETVLDEQPLDTMKQENQSSSANDNELPTPTDIQEPMESEHYLSSDKVNTIDERLSDEPFVDEQMVEQPDHIASEPGADGTQQPFNEEPESDEDFVVVEKNVLTKSNQIQEGPATPENGFDHTSSSVGSVDPSDSSTNSEGRMTLHDETQTPEQKVWCATFDISDYSPEEIHVKTAGQQLVIEAEHEEEAEDGLVSQQFRKTVTIPADVNPDDVTCSLDDEGVLCAKAFRSGPYVVERPVPIAVK